MSGFEHYPKELADLDAQIRHYAAVCGIDPLQYGALESVFHDHHASGHRETLRALLILRLKVETEMLQDGLIPPASDLPVPEED